MFELIHRLLIFFEKEVLMSLYSVLMGLTVSRKTAKNLVVKR